jgi:hypothetical protein
MLDRRAMPSRLEYNKHMWHIKLYQPGMLAMEGNCTEAQHRINSQATAVLVKTRAYTEHLIKEVTEIWLHPNDFKQRYTILPKLFWVLYHKHKKIYDRIKKKTLSQRAND